MRPLGLYYMDGVGYRFWQKRNIEIMPLLVRGENDIVGMSIDTQGMKIGILAAEHEIAGLKGDRRAGNARILFFAASASPYRMLGPGGRRPDARSGHDPCRVCLQRQCVISPYLRANPRPARRF